MGYNYKATNMTEFMHILTPILLTFVSILVSIFIFMLRKLFERVQQLEERQYHNASRETVRVMINEKIDPVREQIVSIDNKLDRIIQIMLSQKK